MFSISAIDCKSSPAEGPDRERTVEWWNEEPADCSERVHPGTELNWLNYCHHNLKWVTFRDQTFKHVLTCLQDIEEIPDDLKQLYKTVWEISQKTVLKMAADRGAYIDQSQSLNIHIAEPNYGKLTSMHFYGWKLVSQGSGDCRFDAS